MTVTANRHPLHRPCSMCWDPSKFSGPAPDHRYLAEDAVTVARIQLEDAHWGGEQDAEAFGNLIDNYAVAVAHAVKVETE